MLISKWQKELLFQGKTLSLMWKWKIIQAHRFYIPMLDLFRLVWSVWFIHKTIGKRIFLKECNQFLFSADEIFSISLQEQVTFLLYFNTSGIYTFQWTQKLLRLKESKYMCFEYATMLKAIAMQGWQKPSFLGFHVQVFYVTVIGVEGLYILLAALKIINLWNLQRHTLYGINIP